MRWPLILNWGVHAQSLSCVWFFVSSLDFQAPLSMGFPRQEYWCGLPLPSPRNLPDSGIKPMSPALAGRFFTTEPPRKPGLLTYKTRSLKVKNHPAMQETQVWSIGWEDPLEEGKATHSSILVWRIPRITQEKRKDIPIWMQSLKE